MKVYRVKTNIMNEGELYPLYHRSQTEAYKVAQHLLKQKIQQWRTNHGIKTIAEVGWAYVNIEECATCHDCGKRYHQSGTIECACRVCESEQCDATVINQSHCTQCEESTQCKLKSTGTYAKNVSASDTKAKSSDHLRLRDVKWVVQPGGNARVRKYRRKNVHAFARGTLVDDRTFWNNLDQSDFKRIIYDPYEYTTFVTRGTKTPVHTSDYAMFNTTYHATDNYYGPRIAAL